ncbi:MAG: hypothetical protein A2539_08505 [Elusimicrobia bacterium RIFOXYD2_FULL_34_15]|nr:MAG: hypothetical protein A2539_08505 [Elusimicrobia bacterium RIFOXYD2_FULL_34_15]
MFNLFKKSGFSRIAVFSCAVLFLFVTSSVKLMALMDNYSPSYPSAPIQTQSETIPATETAALEYYPAQVIDLYLISIENVPAWWSSVLNMNPSIESAIQDLQRKCSQLKIRKHVITRLGYGRDLQYTPYINTAKNTKNNAFLIPYVYFYPGLTNSSWDSIGIDYSFYDSNKIKGRINIDGRIRDGYAMCDMYNHAVRYPEEERLYNKAKTSAILGGEPVPEISLRMLLEKINTAPPEELKNIILINLNGELLPLPPMRNYSDAAKDLQNFQNVRVVTHPENIQYASGSAVNLRVYSYVLNPEDWDTDASLPAITIYIKDIEINESDKIRVDKIIGSNVIDYNRITNIGLGPETFDISYPGDGTLITLRESPLRHPKNPSSDKGLDVANRLYVLEYIPCPVEKDFSKDLISKGDGAKNTARWIISIDDLPNNQYTIETRIGNDVTTGTLNNNPSNLSKTYFWIGQEPPETEKYQFIGDPRCEL